jgi:hypothetical protein
MGGGVDARGRIGPDGPAVTGGRGDADARVRTLADRVAELEAELERRERRHQDVIRRYERLLADERGTGGPDRARGRDGSRGARDGGLLSRVLALLGR